MAVCLHLTWLFFAEERKRVPKRSISITPGVLCAALCHVWPGVEALWVVAVDKGRRMQWVEARQMPAPNEFLPKDTLCCVAPGSRPPLTIPSYACRQRGGGERRASSFILNQAHTASTGRGLWSSVEMVPRGGAASAALSSTYLIPRRVCACVLLAVPSTTTTRTAHAHALFSQPLVPSAHLCPASSTPPSISSTHHLPPSLPPLPHTTNRTEP